MVREITLKVVGDTVYASRDRAGVQGEGNVTAVLVSFDESWDGFTKTMTWWNALGEDPVERTLTADLLVDAARDTRTYKTTVPKEPLVEPGVCTLVIDGYTDGVRGRTASVKLEVAEAPVTEDAGEPADPTPTQAEQLQVQIESIMGDIQRVAQSIDSAEESAKAAERAMDAVSEALNNLSEGDTLVINDLTTGGAAAALSAEQGKVLQQTKRPRKNLLKNWYFPRPANRRGKTSYTGSVQFTIDWWKTNFSGIKVDLEDTGVKVSAASALTSAGWTLYQSIGNASNLVGKNLTLALSVASRSTDNFVAVISYRNAADSEITATTVNVKSDGMVSLTGSVPTGTEGLRVGLYIRSNALSAGDYITLIAAKLELGTEQSLAYQDATGAWHPTEEPTEEEQRLWGLLPRLSNPNLLDNAYFADPINQRGETKISGRYGYFIDRWYLTYLTTADTGYSVEIANGGVTLTGGSNYTFFMQRVDAAITNGLRGKTVTLSAMIDGVVYSASATVPTTATGAQTTLVNKSVTSAAAIQLTENPSGNLQVQLRAAAGSTVFWQAAKLELGTQQTLAYQDDEGNWQLIDPPPNKQQELAKCQRYFVNFGSENYIGVSGMSWSTAANSAFVTIPIPVPMRALPTLTSYNVFLASANGTKFTVNSLAVLDMSPVGIRVRVTRTAAFAEGDQIACMLSNVALSAEL